MHLLFSIFKMRKLSIFFFFILLSTLTFGQKMTVESFEELPLDIIARTNVRLDNNDVPAAVVRVRIVLQDVVFKGAVIGEPVYGIGEYLVYLADGTKKFTVHHKDFLPLDVVFKDYGIDHVEGKSTYCLTIIVDNSQFKQQPTGNYFILKVLPTTARVLINGEPKTIQSDGTLKEYLLNGKYTYTVEAEGYSPQTGSFVMTSERKELAITLKSAKALLTVKTTTPGARIYINEEDRGENQWQGELMPATYLIEVRKDGFRSVTQSVTLAKQEKREVVLPALMPLSGSLNVDFEPIDANVYLDGKLVGKSPNIFPEILVGKHSIKITKDGFADYEGEVSVQENQQTSVVGRLQKKQPVAKEVSDNKSLTFVVQGVKFTLVKVQGGTFTMGATSEQGNDAESDERPAQQVTLSDYYIGQTEVTQALWEAVMLESVERTANKNGWENCGVGLDYPMCYVSYEDCITFITRLNSILANKLNGKKFALPTEAQWEYAARGGIESKGYKYAGSNQLSALAWSESNSNRSTHPVAQKQPNELGLYDMSGNVYEWCSDWYGDYSIAEKKNPKGPNRGSYRVIRGGAWCHNAGCCRVSYRANYLPTNKGNGIGFRLCLIP